MASRRIRASSNLATGIGFYMSASENTAQLPLEGESFEVRRFIKVLVIVVSYRTASLVVQCLRSLFSEQISGLDEGVHISVSVIDNASGDATQIREFVAQESATSWIDVIEADRNGGFAYGNNLGMRRAFESNNVPDYFLLLNPDTEVRKGAIIELVRFLEQHPFVGIAGSSFETDDGIPWPYTFRFPSILSELDSGMGLGIVSALLNNWVVARKMTDSPEAVDWMPGASMMLRHQLIEAVGGMDESFFLYYEETDYCRKVWNAGWAIWYVPASRVMHAAGGSTGVTTPREHPRRLPSYWFVSRRRFFAKNYGWSYAAVTDIVFVGASLLGSLKLLIQGRSDRRVPYLIRDVIRHSVILPKNRRIEPSVEYRPHRAVSPDTISGLSSECADA